jgi:hypothetical protein
VAEDYTRTVRIVRPKVSTDDRGRTVWNEPVETVELELVTTGRLEQILQADDADTRRHLREAARGKDGVLAHDPRRGRYEIIDDDDLKVPAGFSQAGDPPTVVLEPLSSLASIDGGELSLVSTQALRRIIRVEKSEPEEELLEPDQGFDPYNHT